MLNIVQGTPLSGATHVMATLAKAEGKEVYSNIPLLYDHKKLEVGDIGTIGNSVIILDYPRDILTTSPEISERKRDFLVAVLNSDYLGNVIYVTISPKFPIDYRFSKHCDYFVFCDPFSNGIVKFTMSDIKNGGDLKYYQLNIFAKERVLPYTPID